jgi:hypothetical protein
MFDFPKWKTWLEARAVELKDDGFKIEFGVAGPEVSPKPGMGLGIKGKNATGLFQNWHTGETDWTIHAPSDGPMVSHRWGLIATDKSFEGAFNEFFAELRRIDESFGALI